MFTLGAIFLLASSTVIFYLIFSIGVLIFQISKDKNLNQFFQNDPWTLVIYVISIIIVIPLALYIARSNKVKDKFNNFLKNYITQSEEKQHTILTALSNIVIVTDPSLNIISVNIAVERLMRTSLSQIAGKPIWDLLVLKDDVGNIIPFENLPIKAALFDHATHYAEGYFLETKIQTAPKPITMQIKPLTDSAGNVTQIVFVLTDPLAKIGFNTHSSIKNALVRRDMLLNLLANPKLAHESTSVNSTVLLITHIEEDIVIVQEMEDHPIQEIIGFVDLIALVRQITENKVLFYEVIGNIPQVGFSDEDKSEEVYLSNSATQNPGGMTFSRYSAPIDSFLIKTILEKLLDIAVFISGKENIVNVYLSLVPDNKIKIDITFPVQNIEESNLAAFYKKEYKGLNIPSLQRSSGLEGYIAIRLSQVIGLQLHTGINPYKKIVFMSVEIPKQAKITGTE